MSDLGALQEAAVAREQDAPLGDRNARQFRIGTSVGPGGVEAEHAQVRRQPAEVDVEHELGHAQRLGSHARHGGDIERFEHRVDGDAVAVRDEVSKVHRFSVHQDEIDFCVRNAERLNHVFHRRADQEGVVEARESFLGRQEIVQLGVETKPRLLHRSMRILPSGYQPSAAMPAIASLTLGSRDTGSSSPSCNS